MAAEGEALSELADLEPYPQVLVNIRVKDKPELATLPDIVRAMEKAERQMGKRGRVLVRYSGTEPLLRIMLEGPDEREIRDLSELIGSATRRAIGDS
jgi:phosphoglucosamine mutase